MAGADRATTSRLSTQDVLRELSERPWDFDFFRAVRLLENTRPSSPRVGHGQTLADDPVRFCQEASLAFAPSTLTSLTMPKEGGRGAQVPRLFGRFFGLFGPSGPLPLHMTEYARERERAHDPTMARFCDVFHHRMISLFYRAWASAQITVNLERGEHGDPLADRFALFVASLFGMAQGSLRSRDSVQDGAKLFYAGRLSAPTRCAEGLRAIVEDYFKVPASIEQFVGQWTPVPVEYRLRLGESAATGTLGRTAIVGARMWDSQQRFRVRLGPLTLRDYERFLPSSPCRSRQRLIDWVRLYTGGELCWDVQLVLRRDEVPRTRLGSKAGGGRVGWTTWTLSGAASSDRDDLVMEPAGA